MCTSRPMGHSSDRFRGRQAKSSSWMQLERPPFGRSLTKPSEGVSRPPTTPVRKDLVEASDRSGGRGVQGIRGRKVHGETDVFDLDRKGVGNGRDAVCGIDAKAGPSLSNAEPKIARLSPSGSEAFGDDNLKTRELIPGTHSLGDSLHEVEHRATASYRCEEQGRDQGHSGLRGEELLQAKRVLTQLTGRCLYLQTEAPIGEVVESTRARVPPRYRRARALCPKNDGELRPKALDRSLARTLERPKSVTRASSAPSNLASST